MWDLGFKIKAEEKQKKIEISKGKGALVQGQTEKFSIAPQHLQEPRGSLIKDINLTTHQKLLEKSQGLPEEALFSAAKNQLLNNNIVEAKEVFYYLLNTDQKQSKQWHNEIKFYYAYAQFLDGNYFQTLKILETMDEKDAKNIFLKAQALEKRGMKQESLKMYFKILQNFAQSDYYSLARLRIGILR